MQLRRLWSEEQHIPGIPLDETPDLNSCLLYQQLQVVNCCLSRKRRRTIATESLESVMRQSSSNVEDSSPCMDTMPETPVLYARVCTGELVLRLGAYQPTDLIMLETGEPVYSPITQVWLITWTKFTLSLKPSSIVLIYVPVYVSRKGLCSQKI